MTPENGVRRFMSMLKRSLSRAWTLYRAHLPAMLAAMVLELVLRLIVLAPLLFLVRAQTRLLALLTPVLFVLIVLPARQNMAETMHTLDCDGRFSLLHLVSLREYRRKLRQGLRAWPVLLWWLPFVAATGFLVYVATADTIEGFNDVFTVLRFVKNLGGGSTVTGVTRVLLLYAATLLPAAVGLGFHSGLRHCFACGCGKGKRLLRHLRTLVQWLVTLLLYIPFAAVTALASSAYLNSVVEALSNLASGIHLPAPDTNAIIIGVAFLVLCLPVIPFRTLTGSVYNHGMEGDR